MRLSARNQIPARVTAINAGWGCQGWDLLAVDGHRCGPAECQVARMRLSMEFSAALALESQDADVPDQGGCGPAGGQR
jgi:hypothetical protein